MTEQRHDGEFHKADPVYRRRTQVWLLVVALLGVGAVAALHWWLSLLDARFGAGNLGGHIRALHQALGALCVAFGLVAAALAIWLFRIAAATRAERRWPPASMRTSLDVRIRYLTAADSMATRMKGAAAALLLLALGAFAWGARLWLSG